MAKDKEQNPGVIIKFLEKKLSHSKLPYNVQKRLLLFTDIALNIIIVVVLVVFMRTYIMTPFQVYGISMCNTLNFINGKCQDGYGDYIIINKSTYLRLPGWTVGTPQRGDIIVFRPPHNNNEYYIKRVIGLPGEKIKLIDGYVYVFNSQYPDGVKIDEPYLTNDNYGSTFATGGISEFDIPESQYFVLGDNRKRSSDSRICFKESAASPDCGEKGASAYLTMDNIDGKAAISLWPNPRLLYTADYPEFDKKS
jgi:signal peptidase I